MKEVGGWTVRINLSQRSMPPTRCGSPGPASKRTESHDHHEDHSAQGSPKQAEPSQNEPERS